MILILIVINLHVTRLDFTLDLTSLICSRLPPRAPELFAVVEHLFTDWRAVDRLTGIAEQRPHPHYLIILLIGGELGPMAFMECYHAEAEGLHHPLF